MGKPAFTHRLYVDFSGDMGDPLKQGASRVVSVAWILTDEGDRWHNEGMVLQMKRAIGCKDEDELKYRALRRHPQRYEAFKCLKRARIRALVVPVLKERVREAGLRNPVTRQLPILLHHFPIDIVFDHLRQTVPKDELQNVLVQLVFDQVGWSGFREETVRQLQEKHQIVWKVPPEECIKFSDSKKNLMLQLADVIAGLARDYMESLRGVRLPPCQVCWVQQKPMHPRACHTKQLGEASLMTVLRPLLLDSEGKVWERGFLVRPPAARYEYWFVDCVSW